MAVRFAPNIDYLFELDTVQQQTEIEGTVIRLLQGWGSASRGEFRHLGYARYQLEARTARTAIGYQLSDDEMLIIDKIVAHLRLEQSKYYELLNMRYLRMLSIQKIGNESNLSSRVIRKRLEYLNTLVYNLLAREYGTKQRLFLSGKVFGAAYVSSLQS